MNLLRRIGVPPVLLFLFFLLPACRESGDPAAPGNTLALRFAPAAGDSVIFDQWLIDEFGYVRSGTKSRGVWTILSTTTSRFGRDNVITVLDTVLSPVDSLHSRDTLSFAVDARQDIWQYGLLSGLARRLLHRELPRTWDRLTLVSAVAGTAWSVGYLDSAQTEEVTGVVEAEQELFAVKVNGVATVFPAYKVKLTGPRIEYWYWIAETPSGIMRMDEESPLTFGGRYRDAVEVKAPRQPG